MPPTTSSPNSPLREQQCRPIARGEPALAPAAVDQLLPQLPQWNPAPDAAAISRQFRFDDFHRTMAFVNAVAWIAHQQDHHPDLEVGYNRCTVRYSTHAVGGLSLNDFICAAKVDALLSTS